MTLKVKNASMSAKRVKTPLITMITVKPALADQLSVACIYLPVNQERVRVSTLVSRMATRSLAMNLQAGTGLQVVEMDLQVVVVDLQMAEMDLQVVVMAGPQTDPRATLDVES